MKDKKRPEAPRLEGEKPLQTLQECLERFTSAEKLGMNEYNCGNCSGHQKVATKQLTVKRLPPVLCIQLKVGSGNDIFTTFLKGAYTFGQKAIRAWGD